GEQAERGPGGLGRGGGHELGARVWGAAVPWWAGGPCAGGGELAGPRGARALPGRPLVPRARAAALRGAWAERWRSDGPRGWGRRGEWGGLAGPGAPEVSVVALGARGHPATRDIALLHAAAAPRGRAGMGSGPARWWAQDRRDMSRHPEAARGAVDRGAARRGGTDQECRGEVDPSRGARAPGEVGRR